MLKQVLSEIFAENIGVEDFIKLGVEEFAPGIPDKSISSDPSYITRPTISSYTKHRHKAIRAGEHKDLRLFDPKLNTLLSWAGRHWPEPGEKRLFTKQPDHSPAYADFEGTIREGYGAGKVEIEDRNLIEILDSAPDKVTFGIYKGKDEELYSLVKGKDKSWYLLNRTVTKDKYPDIPYYKPVFKDIKWKNIDPENNDQILQEKIDGSLGNIILKPNQPIFITSYRPSTKTKRGLYQYDAKFTNLFPIKAPKNLEDTILRGEITFLTEEGKSVPFKTTAGILNSGIWKARETIADKKLTPKVFLWDIVKHRGENFEEQPYKDKIKLLKEITQEIPQFDIVHTAETPGEKKRLVKDIEEGRSPMTREGVIIRELVKPERRIKRAKIRPTTDVYITNIFPSQKKGEAGGFWYALKEDGKPVGKVGTGFSRQQKQEMLTNPEKWIGQWVETAALERFPSGALRAPSYIRHCFDKNLK